MTRKYDWIHSTASIDTLAKSSKCLRQKCDCAETVLELQIEKKTIFLRRAHIKQNSCTKNSKRISAESRKEFKKPFFFVQPVLVFFSCPGCFYSCTKHSHFQSTELDQSFQVAQSSLRRFNIQFCEFFIQSNQNQTYLLCLESSRYTSWPASDHYENRNQGSAAFFCASFE